MWEGGSHVVSKVTLDFIIKALLKTNYVCIIKNTSNALQLSLI